MGNWISITLSIFTGASVWEGVKFFYPDLSKFIVSYRKAKIQLNNNIDPILKSCDELYGKLYSLSNEDFATFLNPKNTIANDAEQNKKYTYYLLAQFWANLEYIRMKSQYSSITRSRRGGDLIRFIETCESREFRILDRSIQRIIGETLIENTSGSFRVMSLSKFFNTLTDASAPLTKWISKLDEFMMSLSDKENRQKILVYGVIVAALIDYFDPKHNIVRRRNIYLNKLSEKSKKQIQRSLFGHYLKFVKNSGIYYKE